ncbi:probable ATP-dependent RNA helicase kurz [Chrysoperla carnea]|uniref:probable ATP-dependent RNA helicase kurz n=1 Tax=Chrysoperla carnea TaxID=189513 RepID=UPI001D0737FE|nr:probable ATP-dependent RNA helicase kurz [Chrysoperla carnea]
MGKKGFNWKSRQVVDTIIDNTKTKQIQLDDSFKNSSYDSCNTLVLPSKKRKTKIKQQAVIQTKLLSKSKRKVLEKIVERKKKKEKRGSLLEALKQVQVSEEELKQFTPIAAIQTKGLRNFKQQLNLQSNFNKFDDEPVKEVKLNGIKGSFKRKLQSEVDETNKKKKISDLNVVGFDSESENSEDSSDSDGELSEIDNDKAEVSVPEPEIKSEEDDNEDKNSKVSEIPQKNEKRSKEQITHKTSEEGKLQENSKENPSPKIKIESKPATFVSVNRKPEIQAARLKLPILAEEQVVMEKINENQIIIIAGETGSGKTTQVPQFLYEAGYAKEKMIGITEPRRVAAISMSKRVCEEMNLTSEEVSYLIRFEGNVTPKTKIKFMTDGVLLKEIESDFILSKYSVIILDEAHERSVYTDILIGLLSRIVPLRYKRGNPLKLIVMSATLRIEDFTENPRLFKQTPPVLKIDSRQFPVTIHFNKRTNENYLLEAYKKAVKIHNQLPAGGILIFLTGQREVNWLVRKLRKTFPYRLKKSKESENDQEKEEVSDNDSDDDFCSRKLKKKRTKKQIKLPEINLDDYSLPADTEDVDSADGTDIESEDELEDEIVTKNTSQPLWALPLYSLLPSYKQAKVFEAPPEGTRLCVVSTNVAETSLTIPNIKYVIDTGKAKVRLYDKLTGVSTHQVTWASQAAANQRAGRAGRTAPGHCYRLYSSAVFNDTFKEFSEPEIQQKPVDDLYLQMKCMNIDKIVNFPFPSAPDLIQLKSAEKRLIQIGALQPNEQDTNKPSTVTPLGRAISKFPVLPRFGKMLALSHQQNLLPFTICMVAALSVPEVLLEVPIFHTDEMSAKNIRQKWQQTRRAWAGVGNSLLLGDPMVLLRAVGAAEYANSQGSLEKFCNDNGLRHKAVVEIRKLRVQLTNEIKANMPELDLIVDPKMAPPTDIQAKLLRQILLSGMSDQVAKKLDVTEVKEIVDKAKFKYAYQAPELEEPIFMHSSSVLRKTAPEWVVYQEIYENNKMFMRGVTAIEPEWLPTYASAVCNLGEPLKDPEPRYEPKNGKMYCSVTGSFGNQNWLLPQVEIPFPESYAKYKWFAKCILEGQVFKKLERFKKSLLNAPSTMVKTWANLQPRTNVLLKTLMSRKAGSREQLKAIWKTEPDFLLDAYQKWLPESAHNEIALIWPPLD